MFWCQSFSQLSSSGFYHFWRMCKVEIIDASDDLICLNRGIPEHLEINPSKSYTKSAIPYLQQWWVCRLKMFQPLVLRFEDVGTLQVEAVCPTQLHAKGKNRFRARGIFEHIPGQNSFFNGELKITNINTYQFLSQYLNWYIYMNLSFYLSVSQDLS